MKSVQELEQEFDFAINDPKLDCACHKEFNTPFTGNLIFDFSQFTSDQSGRKSDNPTDPAAEYYWPAVPDVDGRRYHTILDVTNKTYHTFFPNDSPQQFYNMTNEKRMYCVMNYVNSGKFTTSGILNILLSYIVWGGSLSKVLLFYHTWYPNTTLQNDVLNDEKGTFIKLIDVRRYVYTNCLGEDSTNNWLGWDRGIINFWKLFKQYFKN